MWPWIKRWRDWAMHDFWPMNRHGPQPQALHYSYEKAGLSLHDQPIPWNAEAVVVEAGPPPPAAARPQGHLPPPLPRPRAGPAQGPRPIEERGRPPPPLRPPP